MLESHKRIGKRLVPPLAEIGTLNEVSWADRLLPELLWIGLLNAEYGVATGAHVCTEVVHAAKPELKELGRNVMLCSTSAFGLFGRDQLARIQERLESAGVLSDLQGAISPLCGAYPKCPLSGLVRRTEDVEPATARIREVLPSLFNRREEAATFVQIHAVYMMFVQGCLTVSRTTSLGNFPAVQAYPRTEESRRIASACRGVVNVLLSDPLDEGGMSWPGYFWNRGLELEKCRPITPKDES